MHLNRFGSSTKLTISSFAELTTRLRFKANGRQADIIVMTFCSREQPTVVCQEIAIEVDAACDLRARASIDLSAIEGRALRYNRNTPGETKPTCDGSVLWESAGALSTCGLAYVTELIGDDAKAQRPPLDGGESAKRICVESSPWPPIQAAPDGGFVPHHFTVSLTIKPHVSSPW